MLARFLRVYCAGDLRTGRRPAARRVRRPLAVALAALLCAAAAYAESGLPAVTVEASTVTVAVTNATEQYVYFDQQGRHSVPAIGEGVAPVFEFTRRGGPIDEPHTIPFKYRRRPDALLDDLGIPSGFTDASVTIPAGHESASYTLQDQRLIDDDVFVFGGQSHNLVDATYGIDPAFSPYELRVWVVENERVQVSVQAVEDEVSEASGTAIFRFSLHGSYISGEIKNGRPLAVTVTDEGDLLGANVPNEVMIQRGSSGPPTATLRFEFSDDQVAERDGRITVTIAPGSWYTPAAGGGSAVVTVRDDDKVGVSIAARDEEVTEGADAVYVLTRSLAGETMTVGVHVEGHRKIMSADTRALADNHAGPDATVNFAPDATSAELRLATEADNKVEGDGLVTVSVAGSGDYAIGTRAAEVLVRDDDVPVVTLDFIYPATTTVVDGRRVGARVEGFRQTEWVLRCSGGYDTSALQLAVHTDHEMNHPASAAVWLSRNVFNQSKTARCDQPRRNSAHHWVGPANGEARSLILPPNDPRFEFWRCTDRFCPRYTVGTPSEATIRVINRSPTITVAAAEERVAEGEAARFELTRHWNQENLWEGGEWAVTVVAVRLGHSGGYVRVPLPDSVSFGVGQTRLTVEVPTADDELVGVDGAVTLELLPDPKPPAANPAANYEIYDHLPGVTPAGGNSRVATIVIADNDSTPVLAIEPAHASEDGGVMAFPVTLSGNGQRHDAVTVRWRTVDGTAVAGADYTAATGALTFAAATGAATATVTVAVLDDREEEPSEVFSVELHAAEGAMFRRGGSTTAATGTIDDDDAAPVSIASIASHDDSHNQEGGHELFLVRLDPVPDESVTVYAQTVAGGTATAGVDYVASTQVLTFGPNDEGLVDGSWVFVVSSIEDAEDEPDETYLVRLSLPADSEVVLDPAASTVVGIILDDDEPSTGIALTAHPERVSEGGGAQEVAVTAALDGAARHTATTVSVAVAAGSAAPEDFTAVAAFDVVIGAGETRATATFSLVPVADAVAEPDETVSLRGAVAGAGSTAETALPVIGTTVTIADDDRRGIELAPRSLTVREGGAASYTVRLTSAPTEPVRVQVQVPADAGIVTDRASVEFTAETWNQARTVAVIANQDEDTDHGLVTIGHVASGGDYTGQPARELTVTVVDDDTPSAAVRLAVTPTTVPEAAGNEGRAIVVTATLDGAVRAEPTAIEVTVAGDTASAADFAAVSAIMLTIPAASGSAAATFTLRPVNDAVDETDETVAVSGATKEGLTVHGATAVIVDDDTRGVIVAPTALSLNEGDSAAYTVSLSSAPDGGVVVVKPQVSAEQGVSVTPSVLTFTAADWATPATVTVTSVRDDDAEDAMTTVSHQVEGADYTKQQVADVVVRVADLTPRLAVADTAVAEGAGAARFVVSLDQTSTQEVTVAFATTDGTARAGSDYTAASGRLTFAPGVSERTITVAVADDTAPEVPEMFRLSLSEPTNAVLDGGGPSWTAIAALSELPANALLAGGEPSWTAMAVIVDDDLPRVTVSALRPELTEGATAVFTLVRNGDASFPLTVTVDVSEDGEMLADGEGTVREGTFDSGSSGVTMLARTVRDDVDEMSSRITASVRAGTGYEAGTPPPVVVTVADDDTRGVTVTPAARTLTEDGSSVYTVALTSEPTGPVTVTATVSGDRDVTVSVQALTFTGADWRTVQTVTVRAAADDDADDDAATIVHTVAGADYDGTPAASVAITVTDDDEQERGLSLVIEPAPALLSWR